VKQEDHQRKMFIEHPTPCDFGFPKIEPKESLESERSFEDEVLEAYLDEHWIKDQNDKFSPCKAEGEGSQAAGFPFSSEEAFDRLIFRLSSRARAAEGA